MFRRDRGAQDFSRYGSDVGKTPAQERLSHTVDHAATDDAIDALRMGIPSYTPRVFASGRIGRLRFLVYTAATLLVAAAITLLIAITVGVMTGSGSGHQGMLSAVGGFAFIAAVIWGVFAVMRQIVRRLHDIDRSGWWALLVLIPMLNLALGIVLLLVPGTAGENRFGPAAKPNHPAIIVAAIVIAAIWYQFYGRSQLVLLHWFV